MFSVAVPPAAKGSKIPGELIVIAALLPITPELLWMRPLLIVSEPVKSLAFWMYNLSELPSSVLAFVEFRIRLPEPVIFPPLS